MKAKLGESLARVGLNGFLVGILCAIGLAGILPEWGSTDSNLPWKPFIQVWHCAAFLLLWTEA